MRGGHRKPGDLSVSIRKDGTDSSNIGNMPLMGPGADVYPHSLNMAK